MTLIAGYDKKAFNKQLKWKDYDIKKQVNNSLCNIHIIIIIINILPA